MSFRVYGMTESEAIRIARRTTPPLPKETAAQWEERIAERVEKIMAGKRQAPVSATYSAPQFCREFIALAQRCGRCRGLHIRRPVEIKAIRRGKTVKKTIWKEC